MSSTANFDWKAPIAITPDLLRRVTDLVASYAALAGRRAVADEGFNPDEIQSAEDAERLYKKTNQFAYSSVARDIRRATTVSWSVSLSNAIKRSDLSLDDVLALTNSEGALIEELQVANGGYGFTCQVSFSKSGFRRSANVRLVGPYETVGHYKNELSQLLAAHTRNWHIVTKGWFGTTLTGLFALAFTAAATLVALNLLKGSELSTSTKSAVLVAVFWLSGSVTPAIMGPVSAWWRSIFPLVEFQIGGGVNSAEARRTWRRATWSVPILIVGMPIVTNLISGWLA